MVLTGTLVSPIAARTAKLTKFEPGIGVAEARAPTQSAVTMFKARFDNDVGALAMHLLLACPVVGFPCWSSQ